MAQHLITARGIAYVPENRRLFPRLSVPTICARQLSLSRTADREQPLIWCSSWFPRLSERLGAACPKRSPGGEQQMLAIGRALMTRRGS